MTKRKTVFLRLILGCAIAIGAVRTSAAQARFAVEAAAGVDASTRAHVERLVEAGLARLTPMFPGTPKRSCVVTAHQSVDSLPPEVRASLHEGTAGVALLGRSEIHLILDESRHHPPHDLRTVVDHELVHILLDQFVGEAAPHVSRWFHEGLAQELSGGPYIGMSEDDLVIAARADRLFRFAELDQDFPGDRSGLRRAYAQSFSFVGFLRRRFGLDALLEAARQSTADGGFRAGFVAVTHGAMLHQVDEWREYVLTGSGAPLRFLMRNCFSFLVVIGFPLLAIAVIRRFRRDDAARRKLEFEERVEHADERHHD
ncbi:MAG: hypothetical protein KDB80_10445 [Planctomycetes bacterium]|nr:hypothetical protein [Planctomycetota bacterium]